MRYFLHLGLLFSLWARRWFCGQGRALSYGLNSSRFQPIITDRRNGWRCMRYRIDTYKHGWGSGGLYCVCSFEGRGGPLLVRDRSGDGWSKLNHVSRCTKIDNYWRNLRIIASFRVWGIKGAKVRHRWAWWTAKWSFLSFQRRFDWYCPSFFGWHPGWHRNSADIVCWTL